MGVEVGVGVKVAVAVGVKVAVGVGVRVGLFRAPAGIGADELRARAIQPGIAAHTTRAVPRISRVMISVAIQFPLRFFDAGLAFLTGFSFLGAGWTGCSLSWSITLMGVDGSFEAGTSGRINGGVVTPP